MFSLKRRNYSLSDESSYFFSDNAVLCIRAGFGVAVLQSPKDRSVVAAFGNILRVIWEFV